MSKGSAAFEFSKSLLGHSAIIPLRRLYSRLAAVSGSGELEDDTVDQ